MRKVQMHAGAISKLLYGLASVREIIHSLKLMDYLPAQTHKPYNYLDVASDVGVNLCNVKSCFTSNNEIFTDKRGVLSCVNISKHT